MSQFALLIRTETETREVLLENEGATLGRHPSNTVQLDERDVSRIHARVRPSSNGVIVEDRESYGGTWFEGAVLRGPLEITHGEPFRIGSVDVFVRDASRPLTPPPWRDSEARLEPIFDDNDFDPPPRPLPSVPPVSLREEPDEPNESALQSTADTASVQDAIRRGIRLIFLEPVPPHDPVRMLEHPLRLGRAPDCDVVIDDDAVAAHHATLQREAGVLILASIDGAAMEVDGVSTSRAELVPGQTVNIGSTRFIVANRAREDVAREATEAASETTVAPRAPATSRFAWPIAGLIILVAIALAVMCFHRGT